MRLLPSLTRTLTCMYPMPSSFARLPFELLCRIFTFAAYTSRRTAYDLCLVASWVLPIIQPVLYEIVSLKSAAALENALTVIQHHSKASDIAMVGSMGI